MEKWVIMCHNVRILQSATVLTREECWVDPGYSHATHHVPDVWVANDELGGHLTKISATGFLGVVGSRRRLHTPEHQREYSLLYSYSLSVMFLQLYEDLLLMPFQGSSTYL